MINNNGILIYKKDTGEVLEFRSGNADLNSIPNNCSYIEYNYSDAIGLPDGYILNNTYNILPPKPGLYHVFNYNTKEWEDSRSLIEIKAKKWSDIKKYRDEEEFSTFTWNNLTFDGNPESQQRIVGTVVLALLDSNIQVNWTLADNTVCTLSSEDIINLGKALSTKISLLHAYTRGIRNQIEMCQTISELDSIVWNFSEI